MTHMVSTKPLPKPFEYHQVCSDVEWENGQPAIFHPGYHYLVAEQDVEKAKKLGATVVDRESVES